MSSLAEMMAKARRAVMRRGVSAADADELVHDAFIKVEQYERAHAAESKEALLVTAAVNLSIDRARRNRRAPFAAHDDIQAIADGAPDPGQMVEERARLAHAARGLDHLPERSEEHKSELQSLMRISYAGFCLKKQKKKLQKNEKVKNKA